MPDPVVVFSATGLFYVDKNLFKLYNIDKFSTLLYDEPLMRRKENL